MKKILKWFFMLSKRLYKKPSFVALLVIIPLLLISFSFAAKQESGFVNIVLAQEDKDDEISSEIINELLSKDSLISFTYIESAEDALKQVKNGTYDEAWVFRNNSKERIRNFFDNELEYVVSVYTKEQNVSVRLAREKLTSSLYKHCVKIYYIDYIRNYCSSLNEISDEQLLVYFENAEIDDSLFTYRNPNSDLENLKNTNYLTIPVRGLLAILTVLCGFAATMYYKQDEAYGTFSFVKNKHKGLIEFGCVITAVLNVSVVLLFSIIISSLSVNIFKEIIILLLFALCCTAFSILIGTIFKSLNTFSAIIPLFVVVCIGVCPVFFDFRSLRILQLLLPPTYYVNSIYNNKYVIYMVIFTAACIGLTYIIRSINGKKALK